MNIDRIHIIYFLTHNKRGYQNLPKPFKPHSNSENGIQYLILTKYYRVIVNSVIAFITPFGTAIPSLEVFRSSDFQL